MTVPYGEHSDAEPATKSCHFLRLDPTGYIQFYTTKQSQECVVDNIGYFLDARGQSLPEGREGWSELLQRIASYCRQMVTIG
jgi:hypothetical protein